MKKCFIDCFISSDYARDLAVTQFRNCKILFFLNHDVENKCVYKEKFWMEKGESV